ARSRREPPGAGDVTDALAQAVQSANGELVRKSLGRPEWQGMGTTLTVVRVDDDQYQYAHVGDSRLYCFRAGTLRQVSRDHALVQELLQAGEITSQQAR